MSKRGKFDTLLITDKTLRYGDCVYQISNLTHVGKYRVEGKTEWFIPLILTAVITVPLIGIMGTLGGPLAEIITIIVVITVVWPFLFGLLGKLLTRDEYALALETNSGSVKLFSSEDENFITDLVSIIAKIMDSQILQANYTVIGVTH
jgi:ABC-type bacteriocin/lantibiotic exporter with double-glycine peptidase domain